MSKNSSSSSSAGIGFFGLLCVALIVLKLLGVITWSWFWVLSPILFPFIILIFILVIILAFATIKFISKKFRFKK